MNTIEILGYFFALLVGVSLGLIGSGGSILAVPILVYLLGVNPVMATAYSLFIVGVTSTVGAVKNAFQGTVDFKTALLFGLPSIVSIYLTRAFLLPLIPETLLTLGTFHFSKSMGLMLLFATVMVSASISMIVPASRNHEVEKRKHHYLIILFDGIMVGILAGLVGAGGGFLIIPALVFFANMPMNRAVGTSLLIISANSVFGFLGALDAGGAINWLLLLAFTSLSTLGIFLGIKMSKSIDGKKLKSTFGWFVLAMGIYILMKEFKILS